MLVDTHCHLNMMVKTAFDVPLNVDSFPDAESILVAAQQADVKTIINVGTSVQESENCIALAREFKNVWATVGIHPNDCTASYKEDLQTIKNWAAKAHDLKIVGIGECGIDRHYPDYNMERQTDAFKYQIELALTYDLALVVHSRDAYQETLRILEEYRHDIKRGVMHCFSYDLAFAQTVTSWNFVLGIGGTVTYPKNEMGRAVVKEIALEKIILETDAPFLPPQHMRGKQNHPMYIATIAQHVALLKNMSAEHVAHVTTQNAYSIFKLDMPSF